MIVGTNSRRRPAAERRAGFFMPRVHCVIPDTQCKPGVPLDHLDWIGRYIVEKTPDVVIHLGDHADMPSLSSYDKGKIQFEGRRYKADVEAAKKGWAVLNGPLEGYNARKRKNNKKLYLPEKHLTLGNHEHRITRAIEENAVLDGTIGIDDLDLTSYGWTVHPFLKPVEIDGVQYAHYFYNPNSGKPYGGVVSTRIKNIGYSFTMGHQQGKDTGEQFLGNGQVRRGLVVGSCYLHDEEYRGYQANNHWRGIVFKHEVRDGYYDMMEISLDYLCRRYEGVGLNDYTPRLYA